MCQCVCVCVCLCVAHRWDVSELMLELLFSILLRNRDRIGNLWPMVYDHLNVSHHLCIRICTRWHSHTL